MKKDGGIKKNCLKKAAAFRKAHDSPKKAHDSPKKESVKSPLVAVKADESDDSIASSESSFADYGEGAFDHISSPDSDGDEKKAQKKKKKHSKHKSHKHKSHTHKRHSKK